MKKTLVVASLLLLVGAGCFGAASTSTTTPPPPTSAEPSNPPGGTDAAAIKLEGSWKLMSLKKPGEAKPMDASGLETSLAFGADGKFTAKFCNSMGGSFHLEGNRLVTSDTASTLMFCDGPIGDIEAAFNADLATGLGVARNDDQLVLLGATGDLYTFAHK